MPAAADAKKAKGTKEIKVRERLRMETATLQLERSDDEIKKLSDVVRQTAYQIHLYFGMGFLEKVYENALLHRLEKIGVKAKAQVKMVVHDADGYAVGFYEADLIVEGKLIVELKAVKALNTAHEAQLMNYLKTTGIQDGMLINFGSEKFEVIKRICPGSKHKPHFVQETEVLS